MSNSRMSEFKEACTPLIKFMGRYYDTHCKIIVSSESAEVVSNEIRIPLDFEVEGIPDIDD